jgi:Tfp pilus assembly protein PilF
MLNLVDRLLMTGRNLQSVGRTHDALHALTRLAALRELPDDVAEETQVRLAEIQLRRRKFGRARRHLTAALRHDEANAHTHFLLATAVEGDDRPDVERALAHYRRSLQLDPEEPGCLCACGLLALENGLRDEGLAYLRKAAELDGDNPETLGKVARGLGMAGLADEARGLLNAGRFRHPRDGRFARLWDDFRFHEARREQEAGRRRGEDADAGPVLLPFERPADFERTTRLGRRLVRQDRPSGLAAPHRRTVPVPRRRHAAR